MASNEKIVRETVLELLNLGATSGPTPFEYSDIEFFVTAYQSSSALSTDGSSFYKITRSYSHWPDKTLTARMKLGRDGKTVEVLRWNTWVDFYDWALAFSPFIYDPLGVGSTFWRTSCIWHLSGKAFSFLGLSGELRNLIYEYCASYNYPGRWRYGWNYLPYTNVITPRFNELLVREHGVCGSLVKTERQCTPSRIINGAAPPLGLLLANKQIYGEFKGLMWTHMDFRFVESYHLMRFIRWPRNRHLMQLRRVTLEFSRDEWIDLLDIRTVPPRHRNHGSPGSFIEAVQALRISNLTMFIRHKALHFVGGRNMKYCVHLTNGYILLYAIIHLAHIDSVKIMGCVSNSQKMVFQQAISERRAGQPASVTEWDLIGKSAFLVSISLTWTELRLPDIRSCVQIYPREALENANYTRLGHHVSCLLLDDGEQHVCLSATPDCGRRGRCMAEGGWYSPIDDAGSGTS